MDSLGRLGSEAGLIAAFQDPCGRIRETSERYLRYLNSKILIPKLIIETKSEYSWMRSISAEALGNTHSELAIPPLLELLINDKENSVAWEATKALGKLNSDLVIPNLLQELTNDNPDVRWRVVGVLGRFETEASILGLQNATNDDVSFVSNRAISILKRFSDFQKLEPFLHKGARSF